MKKNYWLLALIVLFFLLTRLYRLTDIPPALYWDEASIGYNAYSIATTGRDEWGDFLPLHFRAFGEFKLPVYIYMVALAERFLGLTEWGIRLPAVFFSSLTIILVYLIAIRIFNNKTIGLLSAFFLSISPWFLIFSRTGYEATVGLAFFLLGIYFFLKCFEKKFYLLLSLIFFVVTIYSYNSYRIITPLVLFVLAFYLFIKKKKQIKNYLTIGLLSFIIFVISWVPIIRLIVLDNGNSRFQAISIIKQSNNAFESTELLVKNYFSHFSPDYLLIKGDQNIRSHQPGLGQLYLIDVVFLLVGIFYFLKFHNKDGLLLIAIILISPLPAAITTESPHALRTLTMIPFISMIISYGVISLNRKILFLVIPVYLMFFIQTYSSFIMLYSAQSSQDWQYGYKKIFTEYPDLFEQFDKIIISDQYAQPYIFALYYLRYDPRNLTNQITYSPPNNWGFSTVTELNNIYFTKIIRDNLPKGRLLIFATPTDLLREISYKKIIFNLDGRPAFYIYEYHNQ